MTLTGAPGTCTITAHQAGNVSYHPAEDVAQSFAVTSMVKVFLPIVLKQ